MKKAVVTRFVLSSLLTLCVGAFAAELEKVSPETIGLSAAGLARIDAAVQPYLDRKELAGTVVAVARKGKVAYLKSFGVMDVQANQPMREDALFRIASMTKPITSVAVMMLNEEGKLLLTDPISKYIAEFKDPQVMVMTNPADPKSKDFKLVPAKREITVLDLLRHTSGISYRFWGKPIAEVYEKAGISDGIEPVNGTLGDAIKKLAKQPLVNHPGEAYEYGLNTDVLGHLVEVASGMPLDKFFKTRIFDPLKMTDTQFYISDAQRARLAALHLPSEKVPVVKAPEEPTRWGQLIFSPAVPYAATRTYFCAGGGLTSTARDYLRFGQMLLGGGQLDGARILSRKSIELMTANHLGGMSVLDYWAPFGNFGDKFGLGFGVKSPEGMNELGSVGEYMWVGIFNTRFWVDPKEEMVIVMMSQLIPRKPEIETKVHTAVYQALMN